ncbi:acid--amino-acid ligase [Trypanosoma rangeli]|uniref:Acid--amino-acid ligase n=1 Tax=Trypanosoma rangeli TaxID=5698 RepID=A0A422P0J7_TRYRA|nr:acid--amino-acid ligase [Trypanosoma rangeli]RNF11246.1 acid--amino-acid ligase [Trypanosoma rangeli]|eukprot:RNF11246.1 acid--amino-acid ligase [Trypanosoma rangeli]
MLAHSTQEEVGPIQLHLSIFYKGRIFEDSEGITNAEETEVRIATGPHRVNKTNKQRELQYILQYPIPHVTVINPQVHPKQGSNSYFKCHTKGDKNTVARWSVHVSSCDGLLAGHVVHVVVVFTLQYPFVPLLMYSTVFLPLTTVMVSGSGQSITLRLFLICGFAATGAVTKTMNTKRNV